MMREDRKETMQKVAILQALEKQTHQIFAKWKTKSVVNTSSEVLKTMKSKTNKHNVFWKYVL